MRLYLLRHGDAVDASRSTPDAHRWLTARGRDETLRTAEHLRTLAAPVAVLTSPLVRAVQTAEIVHAVGARKDPPTVFAALATGALGEIVERVEDAAHEVLLLVGHEPTLSALARRLCGTDTPSGLEKSSLVVLRRDDGAWSLEDVFVPRAASGAALGGGRR